MPRSYQFHTTATIRFIETHWPRQPLPEIAALLGIPTCKLKGLARRHGLRKRTLLRSQAITDSPAPGRKPVPPRDNT